VSIEVQPDPLLAGGTASITVDVGGGVTEIEVRIDNGREGDQKRIEKVTAYVTDAGKAVATWDVPIDSLWDVAVFNAPGALAESVLIQQPDDGGDGDDGDGDGGGDEGGEG